MILFCFLSAALKFVLDSGSVSCLVPQLAFPFYLHSGVNYNDYICLF